MARLLVIAASVLVALGAGGVYAVQNVLTRPAVVVPGGILDGLRSQDRKSMRDFYAAMADIVVRDGQATPPVCRSTLDLRARHQQALALAFSATGMVGRYSGLGERLDAYLLEAIGSTDVPLTEDVRKRASQAFSSIR